ncbi:DUF2892 domain-containing protein [Streptomyces sp. SID7499]|uniref:DUF2892 domain-containing protein n=1 Tax=Streptomyces sp. SID7499 TaxID=2706086 RepID=A0A6G3Y0Y1_9ACTN|nr:DUF2892 domain-containing protein [Streptomyces sp. SID7499]
MRHVARISPQATKSISGRARSARSPHRCRAGRSRDLDPGPGQGAGCRRRAVALVENACRLLAEQGVHAATLTGRTGAWAAAGHDLHTPAACEARAAWNMERQVRFTVGAMVLLGLVLGLFVHPAFQLLPAGVAAGLVFSALTDTCGMAAVLGKMPHNRPRAADLDAARAALRGR